MRKEGHYIAHITIVTKMILENTPMNISFDVA